MEIDKNIIIIDDAISKESQDLIEQTLLYSGKFDWYYDGRLSAYDDMPYDILKTIVSEKILSDNRFFDMPQFVHSFYSKRIKIESEYYSQISDIINAIPMDVGTIHRAKSNLTLNQTVTNLCNIPHTDLNLDMTYSAIYYVNDSDGDTYIFNEESLLYNEAELTIKQTITPKKGRLVIFDSRILHSSNIPRICPTRCVINIVFNKKINYIR